MYYFSLINKSKLWLLFIPFPYVIIQYILVRDPVQMSCFIHLFLYSVIGALEIAILAKNTKALLQIILTAITIQAIVIFISMFNFGYRVWLEGILVKTGNNAITETFRAPGFSNSTGATLSLVQSLGVLSGWLLLRKNKYFENISGYKTIIVLVLMLFCFLSCIPVGRTGLILSGLFFLLSMLSKPKSIIFSTSLIIIVILLQSRLSDYIEDIMPEQYSIERVYAWAFSFITGDDVTVDNLSAMPIPPLTFETFLGTGIKQNDQGNASGHDAGFVQTYYSIGFFFSVIFFISYLYILNSILSWLPYSIRFIIVFAFFLLELKEPFIFKYSHMFLLLTIHFSVKISKYETIARKNTI